MFGLDKIPKHKLPNDLFGKASAFLNKELLKSNIANNFKREKVNKSTGELLYKNMLTINPEIELERYIDDVKVILYSNELGTKGKIEQRFNIQFSLKRDIGGVKAGEYIELLNHSLHMMMAPDGKSASNGVNDYNKHVRKLKAGGECHIRHELIYADLLTKVSTLVNRKVKRLSGDFVQRCRIWYGLSKTATAWGKKIVPLSGAYWISDKDDSLSGDLTLFIGASMVNVRMDKRKKAHKYVKDQKGNMLLSEGKLINIS